MAKSVPSQGQIKKFTIRYNRLSNLDLSPRRRRDLDEMRDVFHAVYYLAKEISEQDTHARRVIHQAIERLSGA